MHPRAVVADAPPLESHAELGLTGARTDALEVLARQDPARVPELVPLRYGRMAASPFGFLRGAAAVMASDLADSPTSGIETQLCGDAHVGNFGMYASPERRLVFDLNDFDETCRGPFEWDVKRLATSLEVVGLSVGLKRRQRRTIARAAVEAYRQAMANFARQPHLAVWYARADVEELVADLSAQIGTAAVASVHKQLERARRSDHLQALTKLVDVRDGTQRLRSDPPLLMTVDDLFGAAEAEDVRHQMNEMLEGYRGSLSSDRRHLFAQYRVVDLARKVVGVSSVGTRTWVVLLQGIDEGDPLFLQAKETGPSMIAALLRSPQWPHQGERVVAGQRLMQASSDIFLGWQSTARPDGTSTDYYVRQLRDGKASIDVMRLRPSGLERYGRLCGWTLARAHARSGDRTAVAAYLGSDDTFDRAVADFAAAYAQRTVDDHAHLVAEIAAGRLAATSDL